MFGFLMRFFTFSMLLCMLLVIFIWLGATESDRSNAFGLLLTAPLSSASGNAPQLRLGATEPLEYQNGSVADKLIQMTQAVGPDRERDDLFNFIFTNTNIPGASLHGSKAPFMFGDEIVSIKENDCVVLVAGKEGQKASINLNYAVMKNFGVTSNNEIVEFTIFGSTRGHVLAHRNSDGELSFSDDLILRSSLAIERRIEGALEELARYCRGVPTRY